MPITESKLHDGELTLGTTPSMDMSCQITNTRIASAYEDEGDPITTLCGDFLPAGRKVSGRKLEGTFVQDFDLSTGIIAYLWDHDLEVVPFTFTPNDLSSGAVITGNVMLEVPAETYGGDVKARVTSDFSWNIQGEPVRTYSGGAAMAAASG